MLIVLPVLLKAEIRCLEGDWSFSLCLVARPFNSKACNLLMSRENLGYILSWSWRARIASCAFDCAGSIKGVKVRENDEKTKVGRKFEASSSCYAA